MNSLPALGVQIVWHSVLYGLAGRLRHPHAGVSGKQMWRSLNLYYHALGGDLGSAIDRTSLNRSSDSVQLKTHRGLDLQAWSESGTLHLPHRINRFSSADLNRELYYWLTAYLAAGEALPGSENLAPGVRHLAQGVAASASVLRQFPTLEPRYRRLCAEELNQRRSAVPDSGSTNPSKILESAFRHALGSERPLNNAYLADLIRRARNREPVEPCPEWNSQIVPFLPVPLWSFKSPATPGIRIPWLRRRLKPSADGSIKELRDPAFDPTHETPPLAGRPARDLSTYPEWDCFENAYKPDWCRVTERTPNPGSHAAADAGFEELASRVRRRYALIQPEAQWHRNLESGAELDIDAYVAAYSDAKGCGRGDYRCYRESRQRFRDLSVAVLLDASRSTDAWIGDSRVIDVAKQSVAVLSHVLDSSADQFALYGFSSDSRLRVRCERIKDFDEPYDATARNRLLSMQPANYTRMGAAIRHVGSKLAQRMTQKRLLLVLGDGRPHDPTDRYEGRYAMEDTKRAIRELRRRHIHCFGLTVDSQGRSYVRDLFGPGGYAVYSRLESLPDALPHLYVQLTGLSN